MRFVIDVNCHVKITVKRSATLVVPIHWIGVIPYGYRAPQCVRCDG